MEYKIINEQTIMIYFDAQINPTTFNKVQQIERYILEQHHPAIIEIIPSYRALMLNIDLFHGNPQQIILDLKLDSFYVDEDVKTNQTTKTIHLPVCYGGDYGEDIETVATYHQLSIDEVVNIHSQKSYLIYMLGFMPGFPFLGGLDDQLHTPRRKEPRTRIPAGSVGIANNQTGLYPKASPGGWQIIGQTPIHVFDAQREPMCLYSPGDYIKFYAIDQQTFKQIEHEQQDQHFDIEKWVKIENEY
ncbi:5-oxoprolinase subunit PxpB [Staphylococcus caeli]|uniref:5-oxoprolinase subunit PxpB n=1 Tax=Staphylococcus caeli TaxID=2201815 RepID=UPI003F57597D